ncbi:response regulator transcription factor [Soonwooa sp.]|uniref:response regulator transcription factor n=1 Tax=Soonwooa sp. TaxID=1938592 RepID=UPI00289886F4|nr:response regulator transcription factor [Soonwooa sp.]
MIRIAIVEDNFLLSKAIQEKIEFYDNIKIKFTAENGAELLKKMEENSQINLILMDIEMPIMNGIQATEYIKKKYPQIKILILTVMDNDENIYNAIKAGADGYLLKEVTSENLYKSIMDTLEGGAAMTPAIALRTLKFLQNFLYIDSIEKTEDIKLSKREIEVLQQLSKGLSYNKIATNLILSPFTIRKHIENIYKKLHVCSKIEAIEKAKKERLI